MNLAHIHLLLNHVPIIGTLITLGVFLVSLVAAHDDMKQVSLALFSLIAVLAIPTYVSGSGAQNALKDSSEVSASLLGDHPGAALLGFIFMEMPRAVVVA